MDIVCKKCKYKLGRLEFLAYITSNAYDVAKIVVSIAAPILATDIIKYLLTRGILEDLDIEAVKILCRFANEQKMTCPQCSDYQGWKPRKSKIKKIE